MVVALEHWPAHGAPDNPAAWITTTARRRAIDRLRREAHRTRSTRRAGVARRHRVRCGAPTDAGEETESMPIADERLRLVFTCCPPRARDARAGRAHAAHPRRPHDARSGARVPRARADDGAAARAGQAQDPLAGIPYRVPPAEQLAPRLNAVLRVLYLVFNEGYLATEGDDLVRAELCDDAIHLVTLVCDLMPASRNRSDCVR
jgi:RNA polymerase sigma-70 factor (ECF subfamily)